MAYSDPQPKALNANMAPASASSTLPCKPGWNKKYMLRYYNSPFNTHNYLREH